jgi:hypothetical protein
MILLHLVWLLLLFSLCGCNDNPHPDVVGDVGDCVGPQNDARAGGSLNEHVSSVEGGGLAAERDEVGKKQGPFGLGEKEQVMHQGT